MGWSWGSVEGDKKCMKNFGKQEKYFVKARGVCRIFWFYFQRLG